MVAAAKLIGGGLATIGLGGGAIGAGIVFAGAQFNLLLASSM